ncbi:MAG: serine/threonine protein kinase [Labilithrix sp.]|nr:serine/threonine protein kinase [Labilithrix sp.]
MNKSPSNQETLAAVEHDALGSGAGSAAPAVSAPRATGSHPSHPKTPRVDPFIGRTLDGRYLVEQLLGEGGMGVVYLGRHKVIDKRVAIKILRGDMAADAEMVERFLNEARAASSIGNPHIVDISDFGNLEDGSTYFVMEFLDGQGLGRLMTDLTVIPVPRLLHIAKQIAQGLAAAHARGIVHRDLKPDNVMLIPRGTDRDFVKVLDFGIAKVNSESGRLTRAGSVFGTPHYMSPEQAAGVPVDHRTDIYSLGVILYEMAAGKVPFDADNFMGILTQHMYKSPAPIRALMPLPQDVPPGLDAIVLKALSKRVEHRYQSMDEVIHDLTLVEHGQVPAAVQEMMGRSGGFNVPADYFRKLPPGGPAMLPATPSARPRNVMLKGAIGGGIVLVLGALAVVGFYGASKAGPKVDRAAEPAATAPAVTASSPTTAAAPDPAVRQVQVVTFPTDATVFVGSKSYGAAPVTIGVPANEPVTVRIEHAGYVTKEKVLAGDKAREDVTLERTAAPGKAGTKAVPPSLPTSPVGTAAPTAKSTASPTPAAPTGKPASNANVPCDPPKFRDPFDGRCR